MKTVKFIVFFTLHGECIDARSVLDSDTMDLLNSEDSNDISIAEDVKRSFHQKIVDSVGNEFPLEHIKWAAVELPYEQVRSLFNVPTFNLCQETKK